MGASRSARVGALADPDLVEARERFLRVVVLALTPGSHAARGPRARLGCSIAMSHADCTTSEWCRDWYGNYASPWRAGDGER
jgi:hypothetical protein